MKKHALLKRAAAAALLSATIAAPGFALSTATAGAATITALRTECRNAAGTWQADRYGYICWYKDINGGQHADMYDRRGRYRGSY